jgi:hypothetical protein
MLRYFSFACSLSLSLLLPLTGCKDDESSGPPAGRGSETCNEWQGALCDWASRCNASSSQVATCRHQAAAISCKSDEQAANCVSQLSSGACTQAGAAGCDVRDLADPAPATAACNQYVDAVCSAEERCGRSKADCLANPTIGTLCTNLIGHTLDFEQCIEEIGTLPCTASDLPNVCDAVFLQQP